MVLILVSYPQMVNLPLKILLYKEKFYSRVLPVFSLPAVEFPSGTAIFLQKIAGVIIKFQSF